MWHCVETKHISSIPWRTVAVSNLLTQQKRESTRTPTSGGGQAWGQEPASCGAKQLHILPQGRAGGTTDRQSARLTKAGDCTIKWVLWIILLGYYSDTFPVSPEKTLLQTLCLVPCSSQRKEQTKYSAESKNSRKICKFLFITWCTSSPETLHSFPALLLQRMQWKAEQLGTRNPNV